MIFNEALGVQTTVARVSTQPVDACLLGRAIVVRFAARRFGHDHSLALSVLIRYPTVRAGARQRSERRAVQHVTSGGRRARLQLDARIHAVLVDAGPLRRAARIETTLGLGRRRLSRAFAVRQRVSDRQVVGTPAAGGVVAHVANGIRRARRIGGVRARIDAALVDAGSILRAVGVQLAFDRFAPAERIAGEGRLAFAGCAVVVAVAFRVHSAGVVQNARVHAVAVVASLVEVASLVRLALR